MDGGIELSNVVCYNNQLWLNSTANRKMAENSATGTRGKVTDRQLWCSQRRTVVIELQVGDINACTRT